MQNNTPLIDLRAPIEYASGAFPNSINIPLMDDDERHLVGICYKEKGSEKAIALGHQLVRGPIKNKRVDACISFIKKNPKTNIYCFRGGNRSQIMQSWIAEAGVSVPRLQGGYKAFRAHLMGKTDEISKEQKITILGGRTGTGKTILLNGLENAIDLEGLANHRGSSFGRFSTPQPTQVNFESNLSYAMISHKQNLYKNLILEDESKNIGRCFVPDIMYQQMQQADVIVLEQSLDKRIEITHNEYVLASQAEYASSNPNDKNAWVDQIKSSLDRITKRLGSQKHSALTSSLESAWEYQQQSTDASRHKEWISDLLTSYYDPMYDYQISNKDKRVIFSGDTTSIIEYIQTLQIT